MQHRRPGRVPSSCGNARCGWSLKPSGTRGDSRKRCLMDEKLGPTPETVR
jgi:hypothetical protein